MSNFFTTLLTVLQQPFLLEYDLAVLYSLQKSYHPQKGVGLINRKSPPFSGLIKAGLRAFSRLKLREKEFHLLRCSFGRRLKRDFGIAMCSGSSL